MQVCVYIFTGTCIEYVHEMVMAASRRHTGCLGTVRRVHCILYHFNFVPYTCTNAYSNKGIKYLF